MLQDYDAWGEKKNYGKVSMGCIRSTVLIATDGTVLKHWPIVKKAAEHPQQVLDFLKEL
jgi:peroxiredoxin Q/BCP